MSDLEQFAKVRWSDIKQAFKQKPWTLTLQTLAGHREKLPALVLSKTEVTNVCWNKAKTNLVHKCRYGNKHFTKDFTYVC